jgi:hypothetical protein
MKLLLNTIRCLSILTFSVAGFSLSASPTLEDVQAHIANPSDGGSGPTLWFQSTREPNFGSAGEEWGITSNGQMLDSRPDFFGNPDGAFALLPSETRGAAVAGSGGIDFASGPAGTVMISIRTTDNVETLAGVFAKGEFSNDNPLELTVFQGNLRVNHRIDAETKTGSNIFPAEPETWYTMIVSWDLNEVPNILRWHAINMDSGLANTGTLPVSVVGDVVRPIRVAGRSSLNPFHGAVQNLAIYDRALSVDAIMDVIDLYRGEIPVVEGLADLLPDAFWVGPDDQYSHPVLGTFRTNGEIFPYINHTLLGNTLVNASADRETQILYVEASGFSDCSTPLGWMLISAETAPYFYSMRHDSFVFVPGVVLDGGEFWLYDYSVGDWFAYGCHD